MTTFKTVESPFKSDNTASNRCGFTLMNNQVGVVAEVMKTKPNVRVTPLPSMIRVDAERRMDVIYDEISEALGEDSGYFDQAEFEENMSTHYGRMIHLDDRTIMVANPRTRPTTSASTSKPDRGDNVYEKDGEKYFVVDTHMHYWNAAPDNWVEGAEQYAKGWIECFYGYHGLGPENTRWPLEKYQKYSEEDLMRDVFDAGHVDVAIFQPTDLREWYKEGFNTTERDATLFEKYPGKFILNTRWDPREGEDGLKTLRHNVERWGCKGVKLYTAEWRQGSRGWKLTDPEAYKYLEACQELGIRNIHAHKGPTIWPLDKDAFDMSDIDHAATDFPGLNFIVEHSGIPRIDDFCYMATQEPNVYAGLSVVVGALMHARPRFFARCMGELLFWVGEDKMTFGSDYAIWEPKWQVEGFVDWDYPPGAEFDDYPRVNAAGKKKMLGLNAAKLYDIEVPVEYQLKPDQDTPAARDDSVAVTSDSPSA